MLITVLIVILLAVAIGVVIRRSHANKNAAAPKQAPLPLSRLQAKTDIETALEFEANRKETSVNLIQHEMKENQRQFEEQYHNDFEKLKSDLQSGLIHIQKEDQRNFEERYHNDFEKLKNDIQSGFIHIQKENQIHLKKVNEKTHDWMKDLLHSQRMKLQEFIQITNDNIKQDMQSEIQFTEQHIEREIRVMRQFVKEEIQKATLKASPKIIPPKATAAEISKELNTENLEKQLNTIEMTENQLQINIFNDLNCQLADAQKTMVQIHAHLEMLHSLHAMESEFKNQVLSMSE